MTLLFVPSFDEMESESYFDDGLVEFWVERDMCPIWGLS